MNKIDLAIGLAMEAHAGQTDRSGNAAILHSLAVGLMGHTDEEKTAGILHNVIACGAFTAAELLRRGVPQSIVTAVELLTRKPNQEYGQYIQHIVDTNNPIALQVKYNDLSYSYTHSADTPTLQAQYREALEVVKAAIEHCSTISLYEYPTDKAVAIFAGGCFWGVQHAYEKIDGVHRTLVGYIGGEEAYPTYEQVRDHLTHHVEAVLVEYDEAKVSYTDLCKLFFELHDPAQVDGVGPDIGPQYRSCIFYLSDAQRADAISVMEILRSKGHEVNTLLLPKDNFWIGEEYHQQYYAKTGGEPYCHIRVKKF